MVAIGEHNIGFVGGCHYLWRTGAEQTFDTVSVYNLGTKAFWKFNMKEKRCHAAAVVIGNKLLIFGGEVNGTNQCLSSCESHEIHGNSVCESKSISPMSEAKFSHSAVVYDGKYAVILGGRKHERRGRLSNVSMFDPMDGSWTDLPRMPTPKCGFAAGCAGRYIIAAGGKADIRDEEDMFVGPDDYHEYRSADILNMETGTWKKITTMHGFRFVLGGSMVGVSPSSFFFLVAGSCAEDKCEVYTFDMDGWSALPVPNVPNSYWAHPATKMVVAGGKSTALPHDSWSVMPDLETIGCPPQVITIGGRVVVCGENELFGLYIVSTDRLYRLVQYAIRFDCFRKLDIKKRKLQQ